MSVIQRCPSCGTTQATAGECTTCREAQVRYFCTHHDPGIWLTGPTCEACAARSAPPVRPPAPKPSRARPPTREPDSRLRMEPAERPSWIDEGAHLPERSTRREPVLRGEEVSIARAGGWFVELSAAGADRVILGVGFVVVVYLVARSLY